MFVAKNDTSARQNGMPTRPKAVRNLGSDRGGCVIHCRIPAVQESGQVRSIATSGEVGVGWNGSLDRSLPLPSSGRPAAWLRLLESTFVDMLGHDWHWRGRCAIVTLVNDDKDPIVSSVKSSLVMRDWI